MSEYRERLARQIRAALGSHNDDCEAVTVLVGSLRQQLDQAMALVDRFKAATMKAEQNGYGQDSVHHDDSWIDEMGTALDEAQRLRGEVNDD